MRENKLRKLMDKGEPTVGTHIHSVWPGVTELVGHTGVIDYVEFTSTYAPYDLHDLDNLARAAELVDISSMIKVDQEPRTFIAERALAAGIQNILFADIRGVEDAEEAVRAVRCEPKGINGLGMYRTLGYVFCKGSIADLVKWCDDAVVALMIEKKSAVENLEEILSVEGIDMVQFGPGDYSISVGHPGELNHPKVREAELKTIKTALKFGIPPRAEINDPKEAERYIDLGVRDFCIGIDVLILYEWWKSKGSELREALSKA
ncbi:MAG: aldolase/citrate lyase family protein [Candidatus Bathyarchaeia archaeon]